MHLQSRFVGVVLVILTPFIRKVHVITAVTLPGSRGYAFCKSYKELHGHKMWPQE